jgi:hypothetical protein
MSEKMQILQPAVWQVEFGKFNEIFNEFVARIKHSIAEG